MSAAARRGTQSPAGKNVPAAESKGTVGFQPQKKVLLGLSILFIAWVAVLLALYVKTVYPQRHAPGATTEPLERQGAGK